MGILAFLMLSLGLIGVQAKNNWDDNVYNELFKDGKYDKRVRPNIAKSPLQIGVTMYFISATDFSEKDARLTTEFYFRQSWQDQRLSFTGMTAPLIGGEDLDDVIWKPDTFIPGTLANLRKSSHVFVRILPNGTILRSIMIRASTECPLNLRYFPYDTQVCTIDFESYGFNANDVQYHWQKGEQSVGFESIEVQDKKLLGTRISTKEIYLTSGNYSRIQVDLMFTRNPGHFIRNYYGPAVIFALVAWLTFWLPASSIFRGVSLLTCVVSHFALLSRAGDNLPRSQHSTSLDEYLITCLVLSVLALVEYFLVTLLVKPSVAAQGANELEMHTKEKAMESGKNEEGPRTYLARSAKYVFSYKEHKLFHKKIDLACKIIFAAVFLVYNLWYWVSFPAQQI